MNPYLSLSGTRHNPVGALPELGDVPLLPTSALSATSPTRYKCSIPRYLLPNPVTFALDPTIPILKIYKASGLADG